MVVVPSRKVERGAWPTNQLAVPPARSEPIWRAPLPASGSSKTGVSEPMTGQYCTCRPSRVACARSQGAWSDTGAAPGALRRRGG